MNKKDKTYALHCMRTCDQSLQQRSHLAVSQWDSETAQPVLLAHDQPRQVRSPKGPSRQNRITPQS